MSLRATTDHTDHYGRVHLFEIYDDQWGGGVTPHRNTGEGFANFSHQKIDPRKPWDNPIQKGALELSIWLEDSTQEQLLTNIKTGDEQQFYVIHYVDGVQEWQGYIYNDLTTYEENILPYRCTLMAKDFTDLSGKDYALSDNRETVIETIAGLLGQIGFNIPIKTHTSWVEEHITASQDYLRQIYNETKALREFGRTGDETDQPITIEEALNKLLVNHGLILKQTSGAYWIDQLTEYEDPLNVLEAEYDLTGTLQTETTGNDLTVPANTPDLSVVFDYDNRDNSGLPGFKRVKNKFDHRTRVSNISFPENIDLSSQSTFQHSQLFLSDGNQRIRISFRSRCVIDDDNTTAESRFRIQAGPYYLQDDGSWDTSTNDFESDMNAVKPLVNNTDFRNSIDFTTDTLPPDADGTLEVTVLYHIGDFSAVADPTSDTVSEYTFFSFEILNPIAQEGSTSIDYQLTQTTPFSVVSEISDTWFGDAPVGYSPSALRYTTNNGDITGDTWQRRGSTAYRNFHHNLLAEQLDTQRGWRNLKSALLKGVYYPWQVLDYDGDYFYYLGGSWDIWTGSWTVELFQLDIQTRGTDTFEDIPKFTDETGSGSGSTSTGGGGGGLGQSTADARYFRQANNLSEGDPATIRQNIGTVIGSDVQAWSTTLDDLSANLTATATDLNRLDGDLATVQANLGLKDGSADLNFNSLDINGNPFVDGSRNITGLTLDTGQDANIGGTLTGVDASFSDDVNIDGALDVQLDAFFADDIIIDDTNGRMHTETFAGGFGGSGVMLEKVNGFHRLTVDDLVVRRLARFYEIAVEKVRANGGTIVVSPGAEKVTDVAQVGDASWDFNATGFNPFAGDSPGGGMEYTFADQYECFIEEDKFITIAPDDLVWRQQWNGRGTGVTQGVVIATETGSATETENTPARSFTVSITNASEAPDAGHDFAVIGNTTDPSRQNGIIITASDTGNPYRRVYAGVDSLNKFGDTSTIKGQDGRLDNLVVPEFSDLDGSQTNMFGAYWNGNIYINDGHFRGVVTITDPDNSNAATKDYVDSNTGSSANMTIRSDSEPSSRPGGDSLKKGDIWLDTNDGDRPSSWDGSLWVRMYTIIDGGNLETGSVVADKLHADSVTADKIKANAVTADKINVNKLSAITASMGVLNVDDNITVKTGGNIQSESGSYDLTDGVSRLGGSYFDTTDMWGGASSKSNASVRLDFDNGRIYYDAMGDSLFQQVQVATTSTGNEAGELSSYGTWKEEVVSNGSSPSSNNDKLRVRYTHKFGINSIRVEGSLGYSQSTTGTPSFEGIVRVSTGIKGGDIQSLQAGSSQSFSLSIDVSSLSPGTQYEFFINLLAEIQANQFDQGEQATVTGTINRDVVVESSTDPA